MPETRQTSFPALSVHPRVGISLSETDDRMCLSSDDVVVDSCLPAGHTEYLYFSQAPGSLLNGNYTYTRRSTKGAFGVLNITVIPTVRCR